MKLGIITGTTRPGNVGTTVGEWVNDNLATRIFCLFLERMSHFDSHVGEHSGLLRAIGARSADEAEQLACDHVLGFEEAIRAVV